MCGPFISLQGTSIWKTSDGDKMAQVVKCWLLLLVGIFSSSLQAEQRWFQIELIVFTQNFSNTEQFDQIAGGIQWPSRFAELSPSSYPLASLRSAPLAFAQVQAGDRLLNDTYRGLKKSPNYRPLVHLSWIQGVSANQLSDAVHIQSAGLKGFVRIQRGAYLHLLVDLEYAPGQSIYHLNEKRRLKLNETHYLDHPKLGVIARIAPL